MSSYQVSSEIYDGFFYPGITLTYPATAKIVARQVARKVEPNSTFGNGSCNLSRNDFGRCRVSYTVKCFMQLVPPQCRQNIARQVARNISQCNSSFKVAQSNFNSTLSRDLVIKRIDTTTLNHVTTMLWYHVQH